MNVTLNIQFRVDNIMEDYDTWDDNITEHDDLAKEPAQESVLATCLHISTSGAFREHLDPKHCISVRIAFQYEADEDLFPAAAEAPSDIFQETFPPDEHGEPQEEVVENPVPDPEGDASGEEEEFPDFPLPDFPLPDALPVETVTVFLVRTLESKHAAGVLKGIPNTCA